MKKFFVVSVLCVLLGSGFGCNNYRVPEYKSLNQDMVTEDQVHRYEVGGAMKENRLYYSGNVSDKPHRIKIKSYKEIEEQCNELYILLRKKYSKQELSIEDLLKNEFPQIYLEGVIEYLDDEIGYQEQVSSYPMNGFVDIHSLSKVLDGENWQTTLILKKATENEITFRFYYNNFENIHTSGKEILLVRLDEKRLTITRLEESDIVAIDIDKFYKFIVNKLGKDNMFYNVYFNMVLDNRISEATKKNEAEFQKYNQRASLLHQIKNNDLRCLIIKKDLSFFEEKNDLSISKIEMVQYKNNRYLTINVIYLNVFNNINIKLNDQYKIARYLYDHLIRKGIREFSDTYEISDIDGLCFKILATDKNFIDDTGASNFSAYEFYMPKKECLLYINDDITGQDLASSSYILVNGERIELR